MPWKVVNYGLRDHGVFVAFGYGSGGNPTVVYLEFPFWTLAIMLVIAVAVLWLTATSTFRLVNFLRRRHPGPSDSPPR